MTRPPTLRRVAREVVTFPWLPNVASRVPFALKRTRPKKKLSPGYPPLHHPLSIHPAMTILPSLTVPAWGYSAAGPTKRFQDGFFTVGFELVGPKFASAIPLLPNEVSTLP